MPQSTWPDQRGRATHLAAAWSAERRPCFRSDREKREGFTDS
jgi:hypothetical protein